MCPECFEEAKEFLDRNKLLVVRVSFDYEYIGYDQNTKKNINYYLRQQKELKQL